MTIPADAILSGDCRAIHPIEKLASLIRASCPPGGVVGDWFAGSGSFGEACRLSRRRHLGCEIDLETDESARSRIAAAPPFHDGGTA
jgi:site-specific DNA-methyltransferase (adenine-specific)